MDTPTYKCALTCKPTHQIYFFNYGSSVCVCVNLWVQLPQNPEEGVRSLGAKIRKGGTLPGTGARTWTQLLPESRTCSEPSLQSLTTHTKFIDNLGEPCSWIFIACLWLNSQKSVRNWYCLKLELQGYTSTDPAAYDKCLVTNKGKKIFIFWASTEVKSQPFPSLNGCTHSLRSSFILLEGGGWSLPSPNFYYWLKTCSCA